MMAIFSESVLSVIFSAILIWVVQTIRYRYYLKWKFHKKQFETYWKMSPNRVAQKVRCTVSGYRIKYSGNSTTEDDPFEGEFVMNPVNLKMGEGFHTHTKSDGFGFSKIIIRGDNFYVEAPYTVHSNGTEGKRNYQAFVWKRKD